jgi:hypothetical protein
MSYGYEGHQEAVAGAKEVVGELQELLAAATDKAEQAIGAIIMAVGQNPNVESSQNAMNFIALAKQQIEEVYQSTIAANAELDRYAGGF